MLTRVDIPKNFTLVLYRKGFDKTQMIERLETKRVRRFLRRLRLLDKRFNAYLRASYMDGGWNDGYYQSRVDLMRAFNAFVDKNYE